MNQYIYYKNIFSLGGSVTHYYHFLLGFLVPFLLDIKNYDYTKTTFIVDNVFGPMLRVLIQLPFDIKIAPYSVKDYKEVRLVPLDTDLLKRESNKFKLFTYNNYKYINKLMNELCSEFDLITKVQKYDVIVIQRKINISYKTTEYKKSDKYYDAFITSGNQRRSIENFSEFYKFIKKYYKKSSVLQISLEYLPFFEQYYLFNNAKIVIAQHGAALSNLIFMKPKTTIIELIPLASYVDSAANVFPPFSKTCKINHYQYKTNSTHPNINLSDFKNFLDKI
jgi:hypothetical protein